MRSELKRAIGAAIRAYRLKANVAQEALGASQSYVSALENGKWNMSIEKIEQIADVLGVHPVSIIIAGYISAGHERDKKALLSRIRDELKEIDL
jgi:transcriptional regulator with XRE-family HTH domain